MDEEVLFLPSGEVVKLTDTIIDILVSRDNSDYLRSDEKTEIRYNNDLKYWIISDSKRNEFNQGMSWIFSN